MEAYPVQSNFGGIKSYCGMYTLICQLIVYYLVFRIQWFQELNPSFKMSYLQLIVLNPFIDDGSFFLSDVDNGRTHRVQTAYFQRYANGFHLMDSLSTVLCSMTHCPLLKNKIKETSDY